MLLRNGASILTASGLGPAVPQLWNTIAGTPVPLFLATKRTLLRWPQYWDQAVALSLHNTSALAEPAVHWAAYHPAACKRQLRKKLALVLSIL